MQTRFSRCLSVLRIVWRFAKRFSSLPRLRRIGGRKMGLLHDLREPTVIAEYKRTSLPAQNSKASRLTRRGRGCPATNDDYNFLPPAFIEHFFSRIASIPQSIYLTP